MGTLRYNGLHWNVGSDDTKAQLQYNAGQGFSAAFVLAQGNISYGGQTTNQNGWKAICQWIQANKRREGEIVLRLYWPTGNTLSGDPGQSLGTQFYQQIVEPAMDQFGIRNFQVLNELNIEYEPSKSWASLSGDMYNIAYWIKRLAVQNNRGWVYLGFPGPDGNALDPGNPAWNDYWNSYSSIITKSTDQGSAYNWLGVHCYESTGTALAGRMQAQYDSLRGKFPQYPQRYTEYGLPFDSSGLCGIPCNDPNAYQNRANAVASAIQSFRNYVNARTGPDVWSTFFYVAYDTGKEQQNNRDTNHELVLDNTRLGPAQTLANAF